jgi:RHS repeat-associated protein
LITVEFGDRNGYETSISDNKNGAHTRIYYVPDSTDPNYSGMAYFANSASGSVTVQVSLSATEPWAVISAQAWKGAATSAVLDTGAITQHLTTTSLVANANCGAANTPGAAGELILSYMVPDWDFSVTAGANYTLIDLPNSPDNPAFPEYWIQTTAQATNGPFTSAADDWTVGCAAFKPKTSLPTPTLTVSGLPNPSTFNQAVTFTATISSGPTGTITFYDGGTSIGPGSINGTVATITTNALAVGSHSITASWPGNPSYNPVTSSPVTQTVSPITPTLTLSSSLNPSPQGAGVTFTATISNGLTGTVTFYNGGSSIGPGSISGATATITTSTLPAGNDLITASWPGNGTFGPVTSSPLPQTVNQPVSGQTIYSYAPAYDGVGNVTSYTDSVMGTMNFTYDTLNRLATANGNEPHNPYPNYCWNLDSFGNRLTQMSASVAFPNTMGGPTTCQTTGSLGPVVQAQFSGTVNGVNNNQMSWTSTNSNQGQGYDAAGNVKNDGAHQYWYDGEGRVCEVLNTIAGVTTAYIYNAEGQRVAKGTADWQNCDPSTNHFVASTDYVLGPSGEQVTEVTLVNGVATGVAHTNAWADGILLATYDVNGLHFYLTDPLGSRRAQTDYAGVLEQTCQSLPYGDGETCFPTPTENLFTGKERDAESGLDYFGARYLSSSMGRFMSPDWSATPAAIPFADPADPQSLNQYSYVKNNPLNRTDPNGHNWFDVNGKWSWHEGDTWKDGKNTYTSKYTGLLVATQTGTDKKTGATTYSLTLYDQNKAVATGTGFSGGEGHPAVRDGNYMIRLDIRDPNGPNTINPNSALGNPPQFYGIQAMHDIDDGRYRYGVVGAYGPMRARLNPTGGAKDDGDYFHGQTNGHGWTHGCLCYGADTRFINYMWNNMPHVPMPVSIDTPVQKP